MVARTPYLKCEISSIATPRDGNCLIHGKVILMLIMFLLFIVVAIVDGLLNCDSLKYTLSGNLRDEWVNVISDLKLGQGIDQSIQLRNRWVKGSSEWMAGYHGSLQNYKDVFQYSDDEWDFIWSTMRKDKAWDVPNIKDSAGNLLKGNYAPELMIKFIAHDIRCHIIVFDLPSGSTQFCSGNCLKNDNLAFESPLLTIQ